jgi:hypothetical protein
MIVVGDAGKKEFGGKFMEWFLGNLYPEVLVTHKEPASRPITPDSPRWVPTSPRWSPISPRYPYVSCRQQFRRSLTAKEKWGHYSFSTSLAEDASFAFDW